jgi:hypothetical protein
MKQVLLVVFSAVLLCGCRKTADNSNVEALSNKLEAILQNQSLIVSNQVIDYSNQIVVLKEVDDVKAKVEKSNQMALYYYTNQLNAQIFCASNLVEAMASDEQKSVDAINAETRRVSQASASMLLTNDVQIEMESNVQKIKQKLGIY